MDIISFNRYNGWYTNTGLLDTITDNVVGEATEWFSKFKKPILMSEYGADTLAGLHSVSFCKDFKVLQQILEIRIFLENVRNSSKIFLVTSVCMVGRIPDELDVEPFQGVR